ncbi:hypothetical protein CRUP_002306, partial [Coryphaenoides rupestris]
LHGGPDQTGRLPLLRLRHGRGLRDGRHPLPAGLGAAAQRPGHVQPGLHAREGPGHQAGRASGQALLRHGGRGQPRRPGPCVPGPVQAGPGLRRAVPARPQRERAPDPGGPGPAPGPRVGPLPHDCHRPDAGHRHR